MQGSNFTAEEWQNLDFSHVNLAVLRNRNRNRRNRNFLLSGIRIETIIINGSGIGAGIVIK